MTKWIALSKREPVEYSEVLMTDGKIVEKVIIERTYDEKSPRGFKLLYRKGIQMDIYGKQLTHWCMWDDLSTIEEEKKEC